MMIWTGNLASNTAEQHSVNKTIICVTGDDDLDTAEQHSVNKNIICVTGDDDSDGKPGVQYSRTATARNRMLAV